MSQIKKQIKICMETVKIQKNKILEMENKINQHHEFINKVKQLRDEVNCSDDLARKCLDKSNENVENAILLAEAEMIAIENSKHLAKLLNTSIEAARQKLAQHNDDYYSAFKDSVDMGLSMISSSSSDEYLGYNAPPRKKRKLLTKKAKVANKNEQVQQVLQSHICSTQHKKNEDSLRQERHKIQKRHETYQKHERHDKQEKHVRHERHKTHERQEIKEGYTRHEHKRHEIYDRHESHEKHDRHKQHERHENHERYNRHYKQGKYRKHETQGRQEGKGKQKEYQKNDKHERNKNYVRLERN